VAAWVEHIPLFDWVFGNWVGACGYSFGYTFAGLDVDAALSGEAQPAQAAGWFPGDYDPPYHDFKHFPNIVILKDGGYLSLTEHAGHEKTIGALGWALLLGSILILPALFYLIYSFQKKPLIYESETH
jgi:cytochrome d ubiquinol oxidase subunit II